MNRVGHLRKREMGTDLALAVIFVVAAFAATWMIGFFVVCCTPASVPTPLDRDGTGTPLGAACATLRLYGCPEGEPGAGGETCFEHLGRASSVTTVPADCLADAGSAAIVRTCGASASSSTLTFRCRINGGAP